MIRNIVVLALILSGIVGSPAAQLKEARVTEVVQDVKLLPTGAAPTEGATAIKSLPPDCPGTWTRKMAIRFTNSNPRPRAVRRGREVRETWLET